MNEISVKYVESDETGIPHELQYIPVPFIALIGLNATNNAIHAMIWNAFTVNRQTDRSPLYFKLFSDKYNFIPSKQKKSSYEWHIPKGILKTNWLQKHLFEIPSVSVLFFDLNWDELYWNEKRTECVAKVEYLRRSLQGRNTRITLVLIQTSTYLPSVIDDSIVTERAALLCSSCDLNAKSLFVLQVSDVQQLMGYILRMETALYEFAKIYYQHECKLIKGHRDQLNKTTHQLLYVRHQFKIAFFSELKQDFATALKHYKNSYANLMEVRVTLTNLYEIKTIGGFINYKICKLCFQLNTPLDSISQFRKHLDIFKNKSEPKELEFEHSAWLSKQFSLFGDLFDHAINTGLVPSQMQNPGYYYYESSLQAIQRRKLCHLLCTDTQFNDLNKENLELFNSILHPSQQMEFFGQRVWRPGCQTLEPLDSEKEKIGIKALQYKELTSVNHAALIIGLLSSAITQFKKYKCPRMKRYLMALVGEEYFHIKDYSNALTFLTNILPQYKEEGWKTLIEKVLTLALHAAYLSADLISFVKLGFECISSTNKVSLQEKISIQASIQNIMQRQSPLMLPIANENDIGNALILWSNSLQTTIEPTIFTIKMDSIMKFIECKPKFTSKTFYCNQNVILELFLQSNCPNPIKFTKLNILFSDQHYNQFCEIVSTSSVSSENKFDNNLLLMPSKLHMFSFSINPLLQDIGREIMIIGVNLTLGSDSMCAILQWSFKDISSHFIFTGFSHRLSDNQNINNISSLMSTAILKPESNLKLSLEHNPPALMNEFYSMKLLIKNEERFCVKNVRLSSKAMDSNSDEIEIGSECSIFIDNELKQLSESYLLNDMNAGEEIEKQIILKLENIGNYCITFTVIYDATYEMESEQKLISCSISEKIDLEVLLPFLSSCQISNLSSTQVSQIRVDEPFFLNITTKQNTEIPLEIITVNPLFHESINILSKKTNYSKESDAIDESFKIVCSREYSIPISLGIYYISWKRKSVDNNSEIISTLSSETSVPLPLTSVITAPLFVELKYPDICIARNPVILKYNIFNRTDSDIPLELSMGTSDNFMYSGNKLIQLILSAHQNIEQHYIIYPLICGSIILPKFRIVINPETVNATPVDYIDQILPTHLLILPQNKILTNGC